MEALPEIAQVILNYANSPSSSDRIQKKNKKSKHSWMKRFEGNQRLEIHQRSDYASLRLRDGGGEEIVTDKSLNCGQLPLLVKPKQLGCQLRMLVLRHMSP